MVAEFAQLMAIHDGLLDAVPEDRIAAFRDGLDAAMRAEQPRAVGQLERDGTIAEDARDALSAWLGQRIAPLVPAPAETADNGTAATD